MEDINRIYILGAHGLAFSYYKKLAKARSSRALSCHQLVLIDPNPKAVGVKQLENGDLFIEKTYSDFVISYLQNQNGAHPDDILVPDHTAKHVMFQVFWDLVQTSFPGLTLSSKALNLNLNTPFEYKSEDGAHWALSYAKWTCPPDCDEPNICPHTKNKRTWDFNQSLSEPPLDPLTKYSQFSCQQLLGEISYIPFLKIIKETSELIYGIQQNTIRAACVATHSHCHGIIGQFSWNDSLQPYEV